ncbi:MAG: Uma2 family endonuclease [Anaerolineae bacterium]|nr:Uma2 family endonuclease [Anaerolineae bacterium]
MDTPFKQKMSLAEFDKWTNTLDGDVIPEYVAGYATTKLSTTYASVIGVRLGAMLGFYVIPQEIGYLTGAAGGYRVGDGRFVPDIAYISKERQPQLGKEIWNPVPPDLAIEIIAYPDMPHEHTFLRRKVVSYLNFGVIVWIVDTDDKTIDIYQRGEEVRTLTINDTLEAETLFPNFRLKLADIFA